MEFAVGITTYNRPDVLEFTLNKFKGVDVVVVDDCSSVDYPENPLIFRNKERLGIAKSKNKCISMLKDYKYIFLFDDDCFPTKDNWWKPFIDGKEHHYVHACTPHITVKKHIDGKTWWNGALGCCMMIDQEVLRVVGGFDNRFGMWGYEHTEYTNRIYREGLIPHQYITPANVQDFIYSFDAFGSYEDFVWECKASITNEEKAKFGYENGRIYSKVLGEKGFRAYD